MKRGKCHRVASTVLLIYLFVRHAECFRWTRNQQSSYVVNAQLGTDVSLPCEFLLTNEEDSAMQQFHLIYWSREIPAGSQSWQGIAAKSNLISNSRPTIIHGIKSHFAMRENYLTIFNVELEDEGQYQCEVKSSFYTTPSLIKLKISTTRQSSSEQKSTLSKEASAGIGVGTTLVIVGFIAVVAMLWMTRRKKRQVAREATNAETLPRNDAAEAYVGPACRGPHINNGIVENEYSSPEKVATTPC